MRYDLNRIKAWVGESARVLDLGCGDGEFLQQLQTERGALVTGIELDPQNLIQVAGRGINVIQQDMDRGLANFPDNSYDHVVLAHALQVLQRPHVVLQDMVRIGHEAIVTFPNFGHWRCRLQLGFTGLMPVSKAMPYSWFDTPNIHFCTERDFENLCKDLGIEVIDRDIDAGLFGSLLAKFFPNLFAVTAIFRIRRRTC